MKIWGEEADRGRVRNPLFIQELKIFKMMGNRRRKYRFPLKLFVLPEELGKIFFTGSGKLVLAVYGTMKGLLLKSYPRILSYLLLTLSS